MSIDTLSLGNDSIVAVPSLHTSIHPTDLSKSGRRKLRWSPNWRRQVRYVAPPPPRPRALTNGRTGGRTRQAMYALCGYTGPKSNLYARKMIPSVLTSNSDHTRSRLHGKHHIRFLDSFTLYNIVPKNSWVTIGTSLCFELEQI